MYFMSSAEKTAVITLFIIFSMPRKTQTLPFPLPLLTFHNHPPTHLLQ